MTCFFLPIRVFQNFNFHGVCCLIYETGKGALHYLHRQIPNEFECPVLNRFESGVWKRRIGRKFGRIGTRIEGELASEVTVFPVNETEQIAKLRVARNMIPYEIEHALMPE